jgi:hypothetical protein
VASPQATGVGLDDPSPALLNLLVHSGYVTGDALAATVVDLAARGHVHLEQVGPGEVLCRFPHRPPAHRPLLPHERQALDLLMGRAVDGVVPARALGQGVTDEADRWWEQFALAVAREGEAAGLDRAPGGWGPSLLEVFLAAVCLLLFFGCVVVARVVHDPTVSTVCGAACVGAGLWAGVFLRDGERRASLTREGIALGSRWIAERERVLDLLPDALGPDGDLARARVGRAQGFVHDIEIGHSQVARD